MTDVLIKPRYPIFLDNGVIVEMDEEGNFWSLYQQDAHLLPPQGEERFEWVWEHMVSPDEPWRPLRSFNRVRVDKRDRIARIVKSEARR